MLRVGLTGGIGAGKSTVARRLVEHGATLIDADKLAREVVAPGTPGLSRIVAEFGTGVLAADGFLDRAALAAVVFGDNAALATLNGIVHPLVGARTTELVAAAAPDAIVVHDVPLIVENGLAPHYHLVIVVDAPAAERVRRLVESRGMAEDDARARIAAQADEPARHAAADVWLDNSSTPDRVRATVDALWTDRLVPFEANVRLHRKPPRGRPRLVPYDQTWPTQAERVMARLRLIAGERALRVDHVGSTSVPGLAAKDVLDIQVTVPDLATADMLAEPLTAAGFPWRPNITQDTPHPPNPTPGEWAKRMAVSADPKRWVNIHLRAAGSAGQRASLLFRDWLRAEPEVRADYLAMKERMAAANDSIAGYADAKEPWFALAFEDMERWATTTGWRQPPTQLAIVDESQ